MNPMMQQLFRKSLIVAFLITIISGCTSSPVNMTGDMAKQIESKAKITDKVTNESHNVDIEVLFVPNKVVRMDISGILGVKVANLVMDPMKIELATHIDKTFIRGPFQAKTFKPVFRQDVDPRYLWVVINGQELKNGNYQGTQVTTENLEIKDGFQTKRITLENRTFKMIWLLKSQRNLQFKDMTAQNETFVLNPPSDYRIITIK